MRPPPPAFSMAFAASETTRSVPRAFKSIKPSKYSSKSSRPSVTRRAWPVPAFATTTLRGPWAAVACARTAPTSAEVALLRSTGKAKTLAFPSVASKMSALAASSFVADRDAILTLAPRAAAPFAMASPSPWEPPVMNTWASRQEPRIIVARSVATRRTKDATTKTPNNDHVHVLPKKNGRTRNGTCPTATHAAVHSHKDLIINLLG
mmetsp:Transcript_16228/g.52817  ORF Transcript_16228/g.52817 Transcript_16228/m.52817 type:complete len:207 (-) Transcript_16228:7-627(-)